MKIRDLIKDRWYRMVSAGENKIMYMKFEKYDTWIFSYQFHITNGNFIKDEVVFSSLAYFNKLSIKEVELSEVVEYLPIGHPDKILFRKNRINKLFYGIC